MLEAKSHDFGTLQRGADAVYRFPIKNVYKHDIELIDVRSSCGCTTATIDGKSLKPNRTGYIVASFNTRTYAGSQQSTLTIQVAWNDNSVRRTGEAQLSVQGAVEGDVVIEPNAVRFGDVPQGQEREERVRVRAANTKNWRIDTVQCSCEHLSVQVGQLSPDAERVAYDVLVRLTGCAPPGAVCEQLWLVTNEAAQSKIPIHVSGRVVPGFWASPESLFFAEVPRGEKVTKKVIVRSTKPSKIASIQSDGQLFQCKTDEMTATRHVVEITFEPKQVGQAKQQITITSEAGETATITTHATAVPAGTR